jgi:hypothetical protein
MDLLVEVVQENLELDAKMENTAEEEENTQMQLSEEKSDNDSLWGDDSDDEITPVQHSSSIEVYESDEDDLKTEDIVLVSPASTKEIMDNSPLSIVSKSIDYDSGNDDTTKFVAKSKKGVKKIKQEIKKDTKLSVVQSEVEVISVEVSRNVF